MKKCEACGYDNQADPEKDTAGIVRECANCNNPLPKAGECRPAIGHAIGFGCYHMGRVRLSDGSEGR